MHFYQTRTMPLETQLSDRRGQGPYDLKEKKHQQKNTPNNVAITVKVWRHLRFVRFKNGTPLDIASVPLMATAPAEKHVISTIMLLVR